MNLTQQQNKTLTGKKCPECKEGVIYDAEINGEEPCAFCQGTGLPTIEIKKDIVEALPDALKQIDDIFSREDRMTQTKLSRKKEIERLIGIYFSYKVKVEKLSMKGKGNTFKGHEFTYWNNCHSFQEAKLEQLKEDTSEELLFLGKLKKILNKYHSQIPMVEIGMQNVLNDVDNELQLDKRIKHLKEVLK